MLVPLMFNRTGRIPAHRVPSISPSPRTWLVSVLILQCRWKRYAACVTKVCSYCLYCATPSSGQTPPQLFPVNVLCILQFWLKLGIGVCRKCSWRNNWEMHSWCGVWKTHFIYIHLLARTDTQGLMHASVWVLKRSQGLNCLEMRWCIVIQVLF